MYKYECDYCGDPSCPELCPDAKTAHDKWVNSDEFKELQKQRLKDNYLDAKIRYEDSLEGL